MQTPLDYYCQVRGLISGGERFPAPRHPFAGFYQPLDALRAAHGACPDRLAPVQYSSGAAPLWTGEGYPQGRFPHLAVSSELAELWARLALKWQDERLAHAAKKLSAFLSPILRANLTSLWVPEREYKDVPLSMNNDCEEVFSEPELGYELFTKGDAALALTLQGWQTSAGAARLGNIAIPAFGPHTAPLSESGHFGIGPGKDGWFSSFASKESWLRIANPALNPRDCSFSLDSALSHEPVAFVFYVKADNCTVGERVFKPKNLQRYTGEAKEATFQALQSKINLSWDKPLNIELIPLAGGSSYWGSTFLLAVWLPIRHATTRFRMGLTH